MDYKNVRFYHISEVVPEFKSSYEGCLVLDSNNDFYIGLSDKWKKLADKETTLFGYGITDAKIEDGKIILGENEITPITEETEVYIGDPNDAPADAKIIIDNTTDTSVEIYSKTEVDNKLSVLVNDHTVFKREMTDTTAEISPNTFYVWGEVSELTITLAEPEDSTIYNEYMFQFTSGDTATTLSLPEGITWYLGNNVILANKTYQVSIVDNLAVLGEF